MVVVIMNVLLADIEISRQKWEPHFVIIILALCMYIGLTSN